MHRYLFMFMIDNQPCFGKNIEHLCCKCCTNLLVDVRQERDLNIAQYNIYISYFELIYIYIYIYIYYFELKHIRNITCGLNLPNSGHVSIILKVLLEPPSTLLSLQLDRHATYPMVQISGTI